MRDPLGILGQRDVVTPRQRRHVLVLHPRELAEEVFQHGSLASRAARS